ncbi:phage major capsid protein, P2 family [Halomonas urumqiensis]|uniref:Phage major capsid protein, P2 family n=1 Tax=Halomonas urumqiensis TaxID=1684789 RepID=A0A2N7UDP7_9GAMM|nr:phage major capsid protein, P2 family [Halomonas urumqiensis]PMR78540.1 phage major capsid protein, P2 family [Halomonas urumqiensis]PTB03685.1 phage major capsid protein, P2 family [Halomonas urumqiensis]GHE20102.1 phage major capsid protein, P2 family [Halomonas urumqiensis]
MRNDTRKNFNALRDRIAQLSGVDSAAEQFNVEPSVQQTLESRIQESSEFLGRINVVGVDELKGQKVGLGVTGPIAGRTDVTQNDRAPRDVSSLTDQSYECVSTEYDTYISWAKLDAWARFRDFQIRVRNAVVRQQALDRIMIGFNGTSAAVETDRVANPLLQDVNIGWLQKYRDHAPARVLSDGAAAGTITIGETGDYKNLDALVFDAVNELIDPWHREDTTLVAIMGRKMLADKYFPLIQQHGETPTEARALDMIISQKRVGGLGAVRVPFVPDGSMLITSLENLSMYWQRGSRRRYLIDNPKRNRIENYESSNDAYVVEDYGFGCLVENIAFQE